MKEKQNDENKNLTINGTKKRQLRKSVTKSTKKRRKTIKQTSEKSHSVIFANNCR